MVIRCFSFESRKACRKIDHRCAAQISFERRFLDRFPIRVEMKSGISMRAIVHAHADRAQINACTFRFLVCNTKTTWLVTGPFCKIIRNVREISQIFILFSEERAVCSKALPGPSGDRPSLSLINNSARGSFACARVAELIDDRIKLRNHFSRAVAFSTSSRTALTIASGFAHAE